MVGHATLAATYLHLQEGCAQVDRGPVDLQSQHWALLCLRRHEQYRRSLVMHAGDKETQLGSAGQHDGTMRMPVLACCRKHPLDTTHKQEVEGCVLTAVC